MIMMRGLEHIHATKMHDSFGYRLITHTHTFKHTETFKEGRTSLHSKHEICLATG